MQGATKPATDIINAMTFQSTPPMQGATALNKITNYIVAVSIHAPYAGSD